jgi:hypothetical protein
MAEAPQDLPSGAGPAYPEVWKGYAALGKVCSASGPIDGRTARLAKLALAVRALSPGRRPCAPVPAAR